MSGLPVPGQWYWVQCADSGKWVIAKCRGLKSNGDEVDIEWWAAEPLLPRNTRLATDWRHIPPPAKGPA